MNLLITTACSLDCPYCFAGSLRNRRGVREMSLAELEMVLSDLNPDTTLVRLMGGEPTLHSKYPQMIKLLKQRGYQVVVFTNGIQSVLQDTAPYLPDRILLNLNDRRFYSPRQLNNIRENAVALGCRIELGYTITQPDFDLGWHRRLILEAGLRPSIRVGLAQPVVGGDNIYLPDADLPAAHTSVHHWAKRLMADGIRISLDCGFMRCLFNDQVVEDLIRAGTALRFECSPAVDVGPGLQTYHCFALSNQDGPNWLDCNNERDYLDWFSAQDTTYLAQCAECHHMASGWCQGGCRARALMKA